MASKNRIYVYCDACGWQGERSAKTAAAAPCFRCGGPVRRGLPRGARHGPTRRSQIDAAREALARNDLDACRVALEWLAHHEGRRLGAVRVRHERIRSRTVPAGILSVFEAPRLAETIQRAQ